MGSGGDAKGISNGLTETDKGVGLVVQPKQKPLSKAVRVHPF
jgi:hypothetical protein